eukprot:NODE_259_length_12613_cov_0.311411.p6 type:complete len:105 gc:universal NODE_259_length_12613_cov_0.311411:6212-5898(-)
MTFSGGKIVILLLLSNLTVRSNCKLSSFWSDASLDNSKINSLQILVSNCKSVLYIALFNSFFTFDQISSVKYLRVFCKLLLNVSVSLNMALNCCISCCNSSFNS